MTDAKLILHCGAQAATIEQVAAVATPEATETWQPVPHIRLIQGVQAALGLAGFAVQTAEFGLWKDGARFFSVMSLTNGHNDSEYGLAIGVRNSHDRYCSAGLCVGSRVFCCDNLAFSSEVTVLRKHTSRILQDIDRLVATACGRISEHRVLQEQRINAYREFALDETVVHDLLVRSIDAKVIPNADLPKVLTEWRMKGERHPEFAARNAWSLFNAYTEVAKGGNVMALAGRTQRLHGLLDIATGVVLTKPADLADFVVEPEEN